MSVNPAFSLSFIHPHSSHSSPFTLCVVSEAQKLEHPSASLELNGVQYYASMFQKNITLKLRETKRYASKFLSLIEATFRKGGQKRTVGTFYYVILKANREHQLTSYIGCAKSNFSSLCQRYAY